MPSITCAKFARLAGVARPTVHDAAKSGAVVRRRDGRIDPDEEPNKSWLEAHRSLGVDGRGRTLASYPGSKHRRRRGDAAALKTRRTAAEITSLRARPTKTGHKTERLRHATVERDASEAELGTATSELAAALRDAPLESAIREAIVRDIGDSQVAALKVTRDAIARLTGETDRAQCEGAPRPPFRTRGSGFDTNNR